MSSTQRALQKFTRQLKKSEWTDVPTIRMTTSRRKSIVVPYGISVFDTNLLALFIGDGEVKGGKPAGRSSSIRTIKEPIHEIHIQPEDEILVINTGVKTTVYLPKAVEFHTRVFEVIKKPSQEQAVIVCSFEGLVNSNEEYLLEDKATFISDGTEWIKI